MQESRDDLEHARESKVFETKLIGYDEFGNLRYKVSPEHDRNSELAEIMAIDSTNREKRDLWYVMDACWINEWLQFVRTNADVQPAPGPCYNRRLVMKDPITSKWIPKPNLVCEGQQGIGDYRRVSEETWLAFVQLYPGSGPAISTQFISYIDAAQEKEALKIENEETEKDQIKPDEVDEEMKKLIEVEKGYRKTGLYPTENWVITFDAFDLLPKSAQITSEKKGLVNTASAVVADKVEEPIVSKAVSKVSSPATPLPSSAPSNATAAIRVAAKAQTAVSAMRVATKEQTAVSSPAPVSQAKSTKSSTTSVSRKEETSSVQSSDTSSNPASASKPLINKVSGTGTTNVLKSGGKKGRNEDFFKDLFHGEDNEDGGL